jgi:hypothetical protein
MWSLFFILPGLIAGYFMFLRPILHAMPAFKQFYDDADGFWEKVKALAGNSLTIAWGYFIAVVGFIAQWIEPLGNFVGDPELKTQITNAFQANPQVLGYVLMAISAVTIVARLRSIAKG